MYKRQDIEMLRGSGPGFAENNFVFESSQYGSSHYYLRNFNSTDPSTLTTTALRDDGEFYRIMCYDFKYIIEDPSAVFSSTGTYTLTFEVNDHSETVYYNLALLALNCLASIQNYTEFAGDYCSYNETDGLFNQFFIDAVIEKYEGTNDVPPWIMAPYMYVLLQDIFANQYKGEKEKIQDAAKDLSDLISPYAGTLPHLQEFTNSFKDIYDEIFTDLEDVVAEMESSNTEDLITITTTWSDLPQIQYAYITDVEITDPEDEVVEEEEESDPAWSQVGDKVKFQIHQDWGDSNDTEFWNETEKAKWYDDNPLGRTQLEDDEYFTTLLGKLRNFYNTYRGDKMNENRKEYYFMNYDKSPEGVTITNEIWENVDERRRVRIQLVDAKA